MGRESCIANPDVSDWQESIGAKYEEYERGYRLHPKLHDSELHVVWPRTECCLIEIELLLQGIVLCEVVLETL